MQVRCDSRLPISRCFGQVEGGFGAGMFSMISSNASMAERIFCRSARR